MADAATPYPKHQIAASAPAPDSSDVYDCLIIGGGPAGLSAAIYTARFCRSTLVLDFGEGRSTSHEVNENYLGFPDGIAARELRERGVRQAARFGVQFCAAEATDARACGDVYVVAAGEAELRARTLILATGVIDVFPDIPSIEAYVGRSLFWCITCDGYKLRGKHVVVIGRDAEAATTALQFLNFTPHVALVTNVPPGAESWSAETRAHLERVRLPAYRGTIAHVEGNRGMVRGLVLSDGAEVAADALVSQQGSKPNSGLACKLGASCDEAGYVFADEEQRTNVPRFYAAGDVTRALAHQVVTAAHEGATAGQAANYDLYAPWQRES